MYCLRLSCSHNMVLFLHWAMPHSQRTYAKWLAPNLIVLPTTQQGYQLQSTRSWICSFQCLNAQIVYLHNRPPSLSFCLLHFHFIACTIWPSFPFCNISFPFFGCNSPRADERPKMPSPGCQGSSSLPCPSSCQSWEQRKQVFHIKNLTPVKYQPNKWCHRMH